VYICGLDPDRHVNGHVSYVQAHALAACAAGFSPRIFCVAPQAGIEPTRYGILHRVASPARHYMIAPTYRRPIARAVADYVEGGRGGRAPELIHGFGPWTATAAGAVAELARRGIGAVTIASAYTTIAHEWDAIVRGVGDDHGRRLALKYRSWRPWIRTVASRVERDGYRSARLVLVNYDSVARLLCQTFGMGPQIRRVPYAAPAAFDRWRDRGAVPVPDPIRRLEPAQAPLVVSISRHDGRKGLDVLLRALARLHEDGIGFRACLVGPGRLLGDHRRLASSLRLTDRVAIPGQVADVVPYLQHANVFALPSLQEGSGSVSLLEALQAGVAIVASACDGIPEDIVDGKHGLLVAPGDECALKRALGKLLADAELRAELGAAARARHAERFSADPFVAALRDTYADLGVTP
jgi:glycosyltransferase involved in cell wall biosynthesis